MSPVYLYPQYSSSIPFLELKGDQQHGYHDHVTNSNNTYFSRPNSENPHTSSQILAMDYSNRSHEKEKRTNLDQVRIVEDGSCCSNMYTFDKQRDHKVDQKYKKCKPTKLRSMQTWKTTAISTTNMIGERNKQQDHVVQPPSKVYCNTSIENVDINGLKMCSDCHTTTTPLWRSGPKSLCNACGIRQRKARRAAAIAAAAAASAAEVAKDRNVISPISSSTMPNSKAPKLIVDEMTSEVKLDPVRSHTLPLKKRSKVLGASWGYDDTTNTTTTTNIDDSINNNCRKEKKLRIEDFPRDVVQGAILLMALSSG